MKKILALTMALAIGFTGCSQSAASTDDSRKAEKVETSTAVEKKVESTSESESAVKTDEKSSFQNKNYKLYVDTKDIIRDTSKLGSVYKKHYSKYIAYKASNGKDINIVAQDKITDEQLLYAYNMMSFYIGSQGPEKATEIANAMANNGALLNMPNGADGNSPIPMSAVLGQPLYQNEVANVGSEWYTTNNFKYRDAAFEEILHMVHDTGIGTKTNPASQPKLQEKIYTATMNALPKDKKEWGNKGLWGLNSRDWLLHILINHSIFLKLDLLVIRTVQSQQMM